MSRIELILLAFFIACWAVGLLALIDLVEVAGNLPLGLYGLYSLAAACGWVSGNVYVQRRRRQGKAARLKLLVLYYLGPPGLVYLLRAMAPVEDQLAAPLVPLLSFGVFSIFFLVPLTFGAQPPSRPRLGKGSTDGPEDGP